MVQHYVIQWFDSLVKKQKKLLLFLFHEDVFPINELFHSL